MSLADVLNARASQPDSTQASNIGDLLAQRANQTDSTQTIQAPSQGISLPQNKSSWIADLLGGGIKGASNIGSTILQPLQAIGLPQAAASGLRSVGGNSNLVQSLAHGLDPTDGTNQNINQVRRNEVTQGLADMGVNPNSLAYKGGELGSEIAGTAGIGGALAKGAQSIPMVAKYAPQLVNSLASGGFKLGQTGDSVLANALTRAIGGAAVGGASAGLINPDDASTGATLGAALPNVIKAAGSAGSGLLNLAGNAVTGGLGAIGGVGGEAMSGAYQAGKSGDQTFLNNILGKVPLDSVLDDVKTGISNMRQTRSDAYKQGMAQISGDKTVLDFAPIQKAMDDISSMGSYKGQVINKNAAQTVQDLADQISNWGKLNPTEFHTPEGLDKLKQSIGDIRDTAQYGTPQRVAADTAYNAVKNQIVKQAPVYADTMQSYADASQQLNEIQKALSSNQNAAKDTAMRKLQSLMRNNVQTNYGNRLDLANQLQDQGNVSILPALAGQSLNSWMPRGMVGALEKGGGPLAAILHPGVLAAAPFTSPKLMGLGLYGAGRVAGGTGNILNNITNPLIGSSQVQGLLNNPTAASLLTGVPAVMTAQ